MRSSSADMLVGYEGSEEGVRWVLQEVKTEERTMKEACDFSRVVLLYSVSMSMKRETWMEKCRWRNVEDDEEEENDVEEVVKKAWVSVDDGK
jgi:hypothetical protein